MPSLRFQSTSNGSTRSWSPNSPNNRFRLIGSPEFHPPGSPPAVPRGTNIRGLPRSPGSRLGTARPCCSGKFRTADFPRAPGNAPPSAATLFLPVCVLHAKSSLSVRDRMAMGRSATLSIPRNRPRLSRSDPRLPGVPFFRSRGSAEFVCRSCAKDRESTWSAIWDSDIRREQFVVFRVQAFGELFGS